MSARRLGAVLAVLVGCSGSPENTTADGAIAGDAEASSDAESTTDAAIGDAAPRPVVRVLFIGNSYTSSTLPAMVRDLGNDPLSPVTFEVANHTPGGARWDQHDANPAVDTLIAEGWDYVVLQDQSLQFWYPNIKPELVSLDGKIRAAGAETVLYMTWGRGPQAVADGNLRFVHHMLVAAYYDRHGEAVGARVAPAGRAWERALRDPSVTLHTADGSHPNAHGVYLTACVFFMTLTGQSPVGLGVGGSTVTPQQAALYQQIALDTHRAREPEPSPLIGHWTLAGSGEPDDLVAGPTFEAGNANGGAASAFGAGVYAAVPYSPRHRPATITVSVQVHRDDWSVATPRETIVGKRWGYELYQDGSTLFGAIHTVDTMSPAELSVDVSALGPGGHKVALTYDGTTYALWVDGVAADSATTSGDLRYYESGTDTLTPFAGIAIGSKPTHERQGVQEDPPQDSFTGSLDNLRIYDRALTAAELGAL